MHEDKERGRPNRIVIAKVRDPEPHPYSRTGDEFADLKRVLKQTSLSRSTLYREVAGGRFPKPHRLSRGRVGWLCSEVEAWMAACAAGGQL